MFTVFLLSAGGGRSKNSPTHYNLSVLLAFGIQLTINRDSLRFTLSSTLMGGGGGGGGGGEGGGGGGSSVAAIYRDEKVISRFTIYRD